MELFIALTFIFSSKVSSSSSIAKFLSPIEVTLAEWQMKVLGLCGERVTDVNLHEVSFKNLVILTKFLWEKKSILNFCLTTVQPSSPNWLWLTLISPTVYCTVQALPFRSCNLNSITSFVTVSSV